MVKIIVFKPYTSRKNTAFYSGQHPVFKYLQKKYGYQITYFIDNPGVSFDSIKIKYIKINFVFTGFLRLSRKLFGRLKHYWKIPCYGKLEFLKSDVIITEGIHYLLIDFIKRNADKVILNDSVSYDYILSKNQKKYLNKYFCNSLAVVVNDKIRHLYQKNNINVKTQTIGHAVDTDLINFSQRMKFGGRILSIGRLVEEKGYEFIIKAIYDLATRYPFIKLDIYGKGPLESNLIKLINDLNLKNNVFLKGFLNYEDLLRVFSDYDLFVSHPIAVKNFQEPFLLSNIEAMASGLPVVTSDCGGVPYVVKDKALVVKQKNEKGIMEKIEFFIKNPAEVQKYSIEGRKYIEDNFSVDIIAHKWDRAIKEYIKNG